jgi:hypothetical protein
LSWMTGPRTDMGEAEFLEELSDIARMKGLSGILCAGPV